ncbi:MAG: hypothetical protein KBS74_02545 [Clostridiales bacterium]|nr:hypothetical protein [Candidatus Cacconaster stercorequi]
MATRGYNSYRGRGSTGKKLLAAGLVLVLLAAAAFLFCQNYLVYDDENHVHLELPWSKDNDSKTEPENPISPDDVEITREEPKAPAVTELKIKELPFGRMEQDTSDLMQEKALVVNIKQYDGAIAYDTAIELPEEITQGSTVALNNMKALLSGDAYTVARISCLADTAYAFARMDEAGLMRDDLGDVWYDNDGECWLDPTKTGTLNYVTALCKECVDLGFDEILLDNFSYPTTGNVARIHFGEGVEKTAALTDFAQKLREALPDGTILSIVLREPLAENGGDSGLTAKLLSEQFDRIYTDSAVDIAALTAALPADYVMDGRIVPMVTEAPKTGSYLLIG